MTNFFQNCIDGVMIGSGYSLLALCFTIIFGIMRRVNLSFGPSIMLGAFLGTWCFINIGFSPVIVAIITIIGTIFIGIYVERLCFSAIRRDMAMASMVSSFAIWMQLEELSIILLPERTYPFPALFLSGVSEVGPYFLRHEHLLNLGISIFIMLCLVYLLSHSRFGLAIKAISEDQKASMYMGINPNRIIFWTFILVSLIGGMAGFLLLSTDQQITPHFGLWATLKGLTAMMLGGMGSLVGAVLGGLAMGIIEAQTQWYLGNEYRDLSVYLVLFLMLIIFPGGFWAITLFKKIN